MTQTSPIQMDTNPYTPANEVEHTLVEKPFPPVVILILSAVVALIAAAAVATKQPTPLSPFPFASILAIKLFGLPVWGISAIAGAAFSLSHLGHFRGRPRETLSVFPALSLGSMLLLSVPYFVSDFPLGLRERGVTHTTLMLAYNILFAIVAILLWRRARCPGYCRCQVYLGFTVFSWLAWCFLPYLGAVG